MLKKIAVLYGGCSSERAVSLMSGQAVTNALIQKGYDTIGIDIDENFDITLLTRLDLDKAFIALHGGEGEDGTLQGGLQMLNIPYTGSNHSASAIGIDKAITKKVWQSSGVPTPAFLELHEVFYDRFKLSTFMERFNFPVVVKPATQGCSMGINKANNIDELHLFVEEAFKYEGKVLVEAYITGREYTVSILNGEALPVVEIEHSHSLFSHEAKFQAQDTRYHCPARLTPDQEERIQALALTAFAAIDATGWGRVDIIADQNDHFYAIEINTTPGMTARSVFPLASRQIGMDFDDTVEAILHSV